MIITTKFSVGDRVVPVWNKTETISDVCPTCEGAGQLALVKGGTVRCTNRDCWKGQINRRQVFPWAPCVELISTVGQANAQQRGDALKVEYMLFSTGVGSGQVWSEHDLFATEEAAQADCDRRNNPAGPF